MSERIEYIDVMKGIGILLVCLGHCMTKMSFPLNRFILSFHMPLFFFIGGMLAYGHATRTWREFTYKNSYSLLVPQCTFSILSYICSVIVFFVILDKNSFTSLKPWDGVRAWFLLTYFLMNVYLHSFIKYFTKNIHIQIIVSAACFIVFMLLDDGGSGLFQQSLYAFIFGLSGYYFRLMTQYIGKRELGGIGILGYILCAILGYYNQPVGMFNNTYGIRPLFVFTAYIGIFSTIDVAMTMKNSKFLAFMGQNSIIVFVTHLSFMPLFHRAFRYLFTGTLENHGRYPHYLILFFLLILGEIVIIPFCNKYIPFLFGKRKFRSVQ